MNKFLYESGKIFFIRNLAEIEYKLGESLSIAISHKHTFYEKEKNVLTTDIILKTD